SILVHDFFFFSSRRRHTRWPRDWSSDVCSSDLLLREILLTSPVALFTCVCAFVPIFVMPPTRPTIVSPAAAAPPAPLPAAPPEITAAPPAPLVAPLTALPPAPPSR